MKTCLIDMIDGKKTNDTLMGPYDYSRDLPEYLIIASSM